MGSGEVMPDPQIPSSFIPDSEIPSSFIPDQQQEEKLSANILTDYLKRTVTIPRITNWLATGSPIGEKFAGAPSETSVLPEIRQPETWMGGFGKGLYDEFVRPLASPAGFIGSAMPAGGAKIPKLLSAAEELPVRVPLQLGPAPRFIAGEAGIAENRPYIIDIGPINPRIGQKEAGTILPRETEGLTEIPPELAAQRGISFGKPKVVGGRYQGVDYPIGKATRFGARPRPTEITSEELTVNPKPTIDEALQQMKQDTDKVVGKTAQGRPLAQGDEKTVGGYILKPDEVNELKSSLPENDQSLLKKFIGEEEGSLKGLSKAERAAIDKEKVDTVKNIVFRSLEGSERISMNEMHSKVSSIMGRKEFDKLVDDMLTNNEVGQRFAKMADRKLQVPISPVTEPIRAPQAAISKLTEAIRTARPIRELQEELYSRERGQRIAAFESVKDTGMKGAYSRMGKLAGELPKVDYEGLKLDNSDVDKLFDAIVNNQKITSWEKPTAIKGLSKILSGSGVPQRSELAVLSRVYGPEFGQTVMMHGGLLGPLPARAFVDTAHLMKAMQASVDLSAPLRQGLPLIHKKEYWRAFVEMFKYAGSEETFQIAMKAIEERPNYMLGRESGLALTDLTDLTTREEAFLSRHISKVPVFAGSERAYTGFLNKLRADTFDSLIANAQKANLDVQKLAPEIARFVNTATGRGSLGRFDKIAPELNTLLFSPRLIASRLTILNPAYYVKASPFVRKEAIKSLFAIAGAGATITGLSELAGGSIGLNPLSADFGKSKFGNTRVDPYGGFQQYIVAANRFVQGKTDSGAQGIMAPTRWSIAENFGTNKLSPAASLVYDILTSKPKKPGGEKYTRYGQPLNVPIEIGKRFTPMFMQDLYDLYKDDPNIFSAPPEVIFGKGAMAAGAGLGLGLQTYPEKQQNQSSGFRLRLQ